jgi:hypothetical protein
VDFHNFLSNRITSGNSKLSILTHNGAQTADWIFDVLSATKTNGTQQTPSQEILDETKLHYLDQKKYVESLITKWGVAKLELRVWDITKLPNLQTQGPVSIPFQFLIVQHGSHRKVYFLFSGSYFYDFIFRAVNVPVDMGELVTLTKGYFVDKDEKLINIFVNIFDSLFAPMDLLLYNSLQTHYPDKVTVTSNNQGYTI